MLESTRTKMTKFTQDLMAATAFGAKDAGDVPDHVMRGLIKDMNEICDVDASVENLFLPEAERDIRLVTLRRRLSCLHVEAKRLDDAIAKSDMGLTARAFRERRLELNADAENLTAVIRRVENELEIAEGGES